MRGPKHLELRYSGRGHAHRSGVMRKAIPPEDRPIVGSIARQKRPTICDVAQEPSTTVRPATRYQVGHACSHQEYGTEGMDMKVERAAQILYAESASRPYAAPWRTANPNTRQCFRRMATRLLNDMSSGHRIWAVQA